MSATVFVQYLSLHQTSLPLAAMLAALVAARLIVKTAKLGILVALSLAVYLALHR